MSLPKGALIAWEYSRIRKVSFYSQLALAGLFISTPEPPSDGSFIKLFFEIPGGEVRANAFVRNAQPGKGMGVEFTTMGQESRAKLTKLIASLAKK